MGLYSYNGTILYSGEFAISEPAEVMPYENLILYSEQVDVSANWISTAGITSITIDQGLDLNGQSTLDRVITNTGVPYLAQNVTLQASTNYVLSVEAYGTDAFTTFQFQARTNWNLTVFATLQYGAGLTGSTQRFNFEFTTPSTVGGDTCRVYILYSSYGLNGDIYIGRVHLYEGNIGAKSYITTTDTSIKL